MNDWNQNGKRDSGDKTIFHTEVSEKDSKTNRSVNRYDGVDGSVLVDLIVNGVCVLILSIIFSGDVNMNSFTAIISLICLAKIGWSLFVLFINLTSR